jgi:hypothetical protein
MQLLPLSVLLARMMMMPGDVRKEVLVFYFSAEHEYGDH